MSVDSPRFRSQPPPHIEIQVEDDRTGMLPVVLKRAFLDHLAYSQGRDRSTSTPFDRYVALALTVRDRLVFRWMQTQTNYYVKDAKRVYYLSAEFLLGRALYSNLVALDLLEPMRAVLAELGLVLEDLLEPEPDAGLGNGGLGRLAACFLDSMATLGLAGYGYGIRYEFGIFEQALRNGHQVEKPDEWLRFGNPWEIIRPEYAVQVNFYGRVQEERDAEGRLRVRWVDTSQVVGIPYDTPVAGFGNNMVNTLRLWEARASKDFDFQLFSDGDYVRAVEEKNASEVISKVLYPNDHNQAGKELRLKQEYFFVACAVHDIVWRYRKTHPNFDDFAEKVAIQLNDTHPAITVAELMRVLVDEQGLEWDHAWQLTHRAVAYTNHTLLAEALERWPVALFERLLPRHLGIIYEINRRFLRQVADHYPGDLARLGRMSIIEEGPERKVRMAHLAVVGAHAVNGVAALHTELLKKHALHDFAEMWPNRFSNKTNGVTPRRWLHHCNPRLTSLIREAIGPEFVTHLEKLEGLREFAKDSSFVDRLADIKRANKVSLSSFVEKVTGVSIDPSSMFDVQIKRLHEYKRQHLNALHLVRLYLDAKKDPSRLAVPRTVLFAGKAAPGYRMAKLIIKLIGSIAEVVNHDPSLEGRLRVAFLPNYRVSLAERLFPASDLSEQISTAGMEASGTGNMKFALNGALTIGTLDGANIEIREAVGAENFFLFGLTAEEVHAWKSRGYRPWELLDQSPELREVLDVIDSGFFDMEDPTLFRPLTEQLRRDDPYMVLADFADYCRAQNEVASVYASPREWHRRALLNIANMGRFSSDRTIREYASEIWDAKPVPFTLMPYEAP